MVPKHQEISNIFELFIGGKLNELEDKLRKTKIHPNDMLFLNYIIYIIIIS